jgi:cytochrome c oxidase cbb3-type subunit 3
METEFEDARLRSLRDPVPNRAAGKPDVRLAAAGRRVAVGLFAVLLAACSVEKRDVGPSPPGSAPSGPNDPREKHYTTNFYEMSEGGRLFRWIGCDRCHAEGAPGFRNLADAQWRQGGSAPQIYASIAHGAPGMPGYDGLLTPQQIWQLAGYVHGLQEVKPNMRRRNADAQEGEPSGATWSGGLR